MVMLCGHSYSSIRQADDTGRATEIMEIIGKEETLKRVHAAIEKLENK